MPLYEYKCNDCHSEYEELVSIGATENPPCPACASHDVQKKMSACATAGANGASGGASCGRSGFS